MGEREEVWAAACGASSERLRGSGPFTAFSVGPSASYWSESSVSSDACFEMLPPATSSSASSTVVLNAVLSRTCASDGGVGPRPTAARASLLALDVDESERCVENEPFTEPLPLVSVLAAENDADADVGDTRMPAPVSARGAGVRVKVSAEAECSCAGGPQTASVAQVVLVSGPQLLSQALAFADDWASAMALEG